MLQILMGCLFLYKSYCICVRMFSVDLGLDVVYELLYGIWIFDRGFQDLEDVNIDIRNLNTS